MAHRALAAGALDEDAPHLKLKDFFPCPRPAYGTTQRRSLVPVPDYRRYARHFDQINTLTLRIYDLLQEIKVRGLIAAGGDVGNAVAEGRYVEVGEHRVGRAAIGRGVGDALLGGDQRVGGLRSIARTSRTRRPR